MLTWAILLLTAGLIILVLEFFIPSSGILGVIATLCILGAIVTAFRHSQLAGLGFLVSSLVCVPLLLLAAIHYWPDTPLGRRMLIQRPAHQDEVLPETAGYRRVPELIGRRGTARSMMLPGGTVEVDGRKYDAVSEGMAIEAGQPILVIRIETQRLVVRPDERIERAELASPISPAQSLAPAGEARSAEESAPVSSPFEEPLI